MINVIGIIKNSNNDKENTIIERKDYKTMIFNEQRINKNSTNSYLKFDNILNLYKSLPNLNNNIASNKLNIIISKNIDESIQLLFNSINSGIIDKLIYNDLHFPCMITKYIYNTRLEKSSSFVANKKDYINYIKNNFNIIKGHLYLEIKTVRKVYHFLLLNLKFRNKSFYNMIYYLNMKKNKKLNKIKKYDSLIIRNINRKLLENNINVYFLVDNNIKNKNEINKVLKYYFKLITRDTKLKPIIKKKNMKLEVKKKNKKPPIYKYERDILPKLNKTPSLYEYRQDILQKLNKKKKDGVNKTTNKYLGFTYEDIMSDDDSSILDDITDSDIDSTILDDNSDNDSNVWNKKLKKLLDSDSDNDSTILDNKLKENNELKKKNTPILIFEKYLYNDFSRPFLKNDKIYKNKPDKNKPNKINTYILNKKIDRLKYINTKIDYISNIINNKHKDNFNMMNQLLYKRTVLNKLTLENKTSQKDFLDIVKKTRDELKTYIKSLNSILV